MGSEPSSSLMLQFPNCWEEVTHEDYKKVLFLHWDLQNFADIVTFWNTVAGEVAPRRALHSSLELNELEGH